MFKFVPVEKTFSDPISATFRPAIALGRKYSKGDMVLLCETMSASKTFLNSLILREAILASKEYVEQALNITIIDNAAPLDELVTPTEVAKPAGRKGNKPAVKPAVEPVVEVKETPTEETPVVEEPIVETPEEVVTTEITETIVEPTEDIVSTESTTEETVEEDLPVVDGTIEDEFYGE